MLVVVHGDREISLWSAADVVGADLFFKEGDEYRVTVHVGGHKIGDTNEHRSPRQWVSWLRSLR